MDCPSADTLAALVANTLSGPDRQAIADHAASCDHCHALIAGLVDLGEPAPAVLMLHDGARVGRYVIGERLGAGGMGVVYAAVDSELQRRVAIKVLRTDGHGAGDGLAGERLMREAQTLARLTHPNVVTVYDVGTHDGHLFIAMELVDGGTLGAWVRRAPRTTAEIVDRLIEAGRGLAAAHAAGVVHRDVKPDNILVGLDGHARMTDFGLARLGGEAPAPDQVTEAIGGSSSPSLTRTGTLLGTPGYMAPEQLGRGASEAGTDQWAFCATLYESVAGVRPFTLDDVAARSAEIIAGRLAPPAPGRRVPGWVRRIVLRGLRADRDARWPSMDAVVRALERGRLRRRRAVQTLAVVAAVAVVAVALGTSLLGHGVAAPARRTRSAGLQNWTDMRAGCSCPYSACDGGCVSVCSAGDFSTGAAVAGVSLPGRQEALLGASLDGDSILYLAGAGCSIDRLLLAHRHGVVYESTDLTDQVVAAGGVIAEGCCTLAPDGSSLIVSTADRATFARVRLAADTVLAPAPDEFADLVPGRAAGTILRFPVLAADQRALYFRIEDPRAGPGEVGPLDGLYVATRADPRSPFSPGRRLPGRARLYEYVTGVSSDGLSLFLAVDFTTRVMVRTTTAEPFGDPAVALNPAGLAGWRAVPLGDCRRILASTSPGGCVGEDIVWLEAATTPP